MLKRQKHMQHSGYARLHIRLYLNRLSSLCMILATLFIFSFTLVHAEAIPSTSPVIPDYIWAYQGQVAFFESNGKIGLIHKDGRILADAIYEKVYPFHNGFVRVKQNGLWGVIDLSGGDYQSASVGLCWSPIRRIDGCVEG